MADFMQNDKELKIKKYPKPLSFHLNVEQTTPAEENEKQQLVRMNESVTYWKDAARRFSRNRIAMISLLIIMIIAFFAFIGPLISPYSYDQQLRGSERLYPSLSHPFGTDKLGRDVMTRTMIGTRISLIIGLFCSFIVLVIGSVYGAISGYAGGMVDNIMMRVAEILYSIPDLLIIIILRMALKAPLDAMFPHAKLGSSVISIFITFALLYWVSMSRMVRSQILIIKQQEYVTAARAMGAKPGRIIFRHLIPNCIGTMIVTTMFQIPMAIFTESFLSFIGLGVNAPLASLGSLTSDALNGMQTYPHLMLAPASIICLIILAFNLFGDGLRDALDPRMKN